jgi:hypothetical protein
MANNGPELISGHGRQGTAMDISLKMESKSINVLCMKDWHALRF